MLAHSHPELANKYNAHGALPQGSSAYHRPDEFLAKVQLAFALHLPQDLTVDRMKVRYDSSANNSGARKWSMYGLLSRLQYQRFNIFIDPGSRTGLLPPAKNSSSIDCRRSRPPYSVQCCMRSIQVSINKLRTLWTPRLWLNISN